MGLNGFISGHFNRWSVWRYTAMLHRLAMVGSWQWTRIPGRLCFYALFGAAEKHRSYNVYRNRNDFVTQVIEKWPQASSPC